LMLPATLLEQTKSTNIDIASGKDTELFVTADTSFFSSSSLELADLGPLGFSLHPVDELGAPVADVQLGYVTVPSFAVSRGFNILRNTSIVLEKTSSSEPYVASFLGIWGSGLEQNVAIRGPTRSPFPFLENVTTQIVAIAGVARGMIKSASVSGFDSLIGHDPRGKPCSLLESSECLKGGVVTVQNVLHHAIKLTDIAMDINLLEDLAYDAVMHTLEFIPKPVSCSKGSRLTRMRSVPGMWTYLNTSRASDASVQVPGVPHGGETVLTSFFLAGEPQPGQSDGTRCFGKLDTMDCCFTTILPAAACLSQHRDLSIIPSSLRGNLTLWVDSFNISTTLEQRGVPINFAHDVPNFRVGPISMSCQDFTFH